MASVVIKANESLSNAIILGDSKIISIVTPSSWTSANLTFQGANDLDDTFVDIYDSAGNEIAIVADTDRIITDLPELAGIKYLKVRSGTSSAPVVQGGDRLIKFLSK